MIEKLAFVGQSANVLQQLQHPFIEWLLLHDDALPRLQSLAVIGHLDSTSALAFFQRGVRSLRVWSMDPPTLPATTMVALHLKEEKERAAAAAAACAADRDDSASDLNNAIAPLRYNTQVYNLDQQAVVRSRCPLSPRLREPCCPDPSFAAGHVVTCDWCNAAECQRCPCSVTREDVWGHVKQQYLLTAELRSFTSYICGQCRARDFWLTRSGSLISLQRFK
jgi:hypothetical protein